MSRTSTILIYATCFCLFPSFSALGSPPKESGAQPSLTLTATERADLELENARRMFEEASAPDRSVNDAIRLVGEAVTVTRAAAQLARSAARTREELVAAQDIQRRARVFEEARQLIYETRYVTRVASELTDLRERIATVRPECGLPGFSADWNFNFREVERRLDRARRGETDLEAARSSIDGQMEALHISVQAHESYSIELCSLYDVYWDGVADRESSLLSGPRLSKMVQDFERREAEARRIPSNTCFVQGYLRVMPSRDSTGAPTVGNASMFRARFWSDHAVAFVRDHLVPGEAGLTLEVPRGTRMHTTRSDYAVHCRANDLFLTTIEEQVLSTGNYTVVHQYGRLSRNGEYYGRSDSSPVELYLVGIRDAIRQQAAEDLEIDPESRSTYDREYNRRFARLEWIGTRMEQNVRVVRMMAGDLEGGDRQAFLMLFTRHSQEYEQRQVAEEKTAAQLQLAREANRTRLEEAKMLADARLQAARISADAAIRVAKEQAAARRFTAIVGGISGILGKVVPTTATVTELSGVAPE